jgi:mono/diheme cytochrome c family protein
MNARRYVSIRYMPSLLALATAVLSLGCAENLFPTGKSLGNGVSVSSSSSSLKNSFETKALGVLRANCVGCHADSSGPANVYGLMDEAHLLSSRLVVAGQPASSPLYNAIGGGTMPPAGPLSASDKATISDWITAAKASTVVAVPTATPTPPPAATATPLPATFASINATILAPKCVGCHSTANPQGGYAYDTFAKTLLSVNKTTPTSSLLYARTLSAAMPKGGTALTPDQEAQILLWIQNGALNN